MTTIPGPKGPPFLRQAPDLIAGAPAFLSRLADEYGPIARFGAFFNTFYLIADPELAREALVTQAANFPKSPRDVKILSRLVGDGLVTANGEAHKRQRRLAQPAFHTKRIDTYAATMMQYTTAMLDEWQDGQTLDVAEAMRELTMFIVAQTLFGVDMMTMRGTAERVGEAIRIVQNIADKEFQSPFIWPDWLPTAMNRDRRRATAVLYDTIDRLIAERRAAGSVDTGDLLSMLLLSRDEAGDAFSDGEVRDQLLTFFLAGHETTSNALAWTWSLLSGHPAAEARLHAEVDAVGPLDALGGPPTLADLPRLPYTMQIIKEALRLYPPAWSLNVRQAAADTKLGSYPIRRGEMIWISPYVLHRRPAYFPNPECFDPDRWTPERERALPRYGYLPFGGGPRVCIGNGFALMEAHLIVAAVARRFRPRLLPDQAIDLNAQITLSNHGGLRVRLEKR